MILVNGHETGVVDARDRGLAYGDGVFRTFPLRGGRAVLWPRQYAKLAHDAAALAIRAPVAEILEHDLATIAARHADGAVRITLTRGVSARGYAPPEDIDVTRIVSWSGFAANPALDPKHGVRVRWCNLRLAIQPALAGIKHLNRLENVLARAEWRDPDVAEGLLCDSAGSVIGGTMSNLFLLRGGVLTTPALNGCGIAGVTRDVVIERARSEGVAVRIAPVSVPEVHAADALFLVNSLIGVWPVAALEGSAWQPSPFAATLENWIRDAAHE
jgi:4-amino-4-deoxychorismate lyase